MKKYFFLVFFSISVAVIIAGTSGFAQNQAPIQAPKTLEEAETIGEKILTGFPSVFGKVWQEALGIWKALWQKLKNFWSVYIKPPIINLLNRIKNFLRIEIEKRKPGIEQEFEKEKKELKEEIPKTGKSIWEKFWGKFKDLIK